jgi:phosphoglycerate dehydrogenase-like enzyme
VAITNASGVHAPNIAEQVMAYMLAFSRHLPRYLRHQLADRWQRDVRSREDASFVELDGATLLVVGLGHIGEALAHRARAFGMRVEGIRHAAAPPTADVVKIVGLDALDEVLPHADHVCLALPLSAATRHLFDAARFARMKPGAHLYNIARGGLVDEPALIEALQRGHLGGAGLDVFEEEPLPASSPLWQLPNVILTPHVAGVTSRYFDRFAPLLAENLGRWLDGRPLKNRYDPTRGY